jgi:hypothetical protein
VLPKQTKAIKKKEAQKKPDIYRQGCGANLAFVLLYRSKAGLPKLADKITSFGH